MITGIPSVNAPDAIPLNVPPPAPTALQALPSYALKPPSELLKYTSPSDAVPGFAECDANPTLFGSYSRGSISCLLQILAYDLPIFRKLPARQTYISFRSFC